MEHKFQLHWKVLRRKVKLSVMSAGQLTSESYTCQSTEWSQAAKVGVRRLINKWCRLEKVSNNSKMAKVPMTWMWSARGTQGLMRMTSVISVWVPAWMLMAFISGKLMLEEENNYTINSNNTLSHTEIHLENHGQVHVLCLPWVRNFPSTNLCCFCLYLIRNRHFNKACVVNNLKIYDNFRKHMGNWLKSSFTTK